MATEAPPCGSLCEFLSGGRIRHVLFFLGLALMYKIAPILSPALGAWLVAQRDFMLSPLFHWMGKLFCVINFALTGDQLACNSIAVQTTSFLMTNISRVSWVMMALACLPQLFVS